MAIEEILVALDKQARLEADQIVAEAQAEADQITEGVKRDAQAAADASVDRAVDEANQAAERELNADSTAHRRQSADVRREVFDEVFIQAGEKIKAIRGGKDYPQILKRLIAEATSDMGEGYVLHADPLDKELVAQLSPGVPCVADITTMGGIVVTSADGRVRRSSTFEDRLKRVQEDHIESVAKVLGA